MLEDIIKKYRRFSRGYAADPPAFVHPNILVGPGVFLTPGFVSRCNINCVINCVGDIETPAWIRVSPEIRYACIPMLDDPKYPILEKHYTEFQTLMDYCMRHPRTQIIYVHCQAGINRSATMALAYVCKRFRFPLYRAVENMARQRPCILMNLGFQNQLENFVVS